MFNNIGRPDQRSVLEHVVLTAYVAELAEWDSRPHLERIRRYTYTLARGMELDHEAAELLSVACVLHDVGKITLPVHILKKVTPLEPAEYKAMEKHTLEGARLLRGADSPILQMAEIIARTHHERWDGSGYPAGLKAAAIPLSGRIMGLADVFDALTTKRAYKGIVSSEAALDLVQASSGTLFDPKLVSVFVERFHELESMQQKKRAGSGAQAR